MVPSMNTSSKCPYEVGSSSQYFVQYVDMLTKGMLPVIANRQTFQGLFAEQSTSINGDARFPRRLCIIYPYNR